MTRPLARSRLSNPGTGKVLVSSSQRQVQLLVPLSLLFRSYPHNFACG